MEDFLYDEDLKIPIHCTSADPESVCFTHDIDGVVIEVKELCGVVGCVHYLFLTEFQAHLIGNHYAILKKHTKLSRYTEKEICVFAQLWLDVWTCGWWLLFQCLSCANKHL